MERSTTITLERPYVTRPNGRPRAEKRSRRHTRRSRLGPYLPLAPAMVFLLGLTTYPLVYDVWVSLHNWNLLSPVHPFVGGANYAAALTSGQFWQSVRITVEFVLETVPAELLLGIALAVLVSEIPKARGLVRSTLLAPFVLAPTAVGLLWLIMYDEGYGVVNYFTSVLGLGRHNWVASPGLALPGLALVDIWEWCPFVFLVVLAGLQAVPVESLEAAAVEGASWWQRVRYLEVPLARDAVLVALLFRLISAFRTYDTVYMMTAGGPVRDTNVLSWAIYQQGFSVQNMSLAATWGILLLAIVVVGTTVLYRLLERHRVS
jgi:multiple sugar transport system permease protein